MLVAGHGVKSTGLCVVRSEESWLYLPLSGGLRSRGHREALGGYPAPLRLVPGTSHTWNSQTSKPQDRSPIPPSASLLRGNE